MTYSQGEMMFGSVLLWLFMVNGHLAHKSCVAQQTPVEAKRLREEPMKSIGTCSG